MKVTIKSKAELEKLSVHPGFIAEFAGKTFEIATLSLKGVNGWELSGEQVKEAK